MRGRHEKLGGGDQADDDEDAEGDADGESAVDDDGDGEDDDDEPADDDDEPEDDDPHRWLLEEDSQAPNLVPEKNPRNVLAGRIEILELLGQGGMGAVWRGFHLKLERHVAVKVLDETLQLRADGRERFIREAQALAKLQHPGVVGVYDCDELPDGKLYLCMELLEGDTLREVIKRGERLDALAVIDVGRQVCAAVEAAHQRGILHRDLTPSNIIRLRDEVRTIKVIDWGLCKYLDLFYIRTPPKYGAPPGSRLVTPLGARFGTPEYMAPEMILQKDPGLPSFRTDVYALGVVLYELLTGCHPFAPGDRRTPRAICEAHPGFEHAALEAALRGALCYDPDQRTQTMAELGGALERARVSIQASPTSGVALGDIQGSASATSVSSGVAGAASVSATCLAESVIRASDLRPVAAAARTRRGGWAVLAIGVALVVGVGAGSLGTMAIQRGHIPDDSRARSLVAQIEQESAGRRTAEVRAEQCEEALRAVQMPSKPPAVDLARPVEPEQPDVEPGPARQVLAATSHREQPPRARLPRPSPSATFEAVMTRLGAKIRGCAREAGVAEDRITVQVRYKAAAIDAVRVLKMSKEHPLSTCVDKIIRKAAPPPGKNPVEDFVFATTPGGNGG